MYDNIKVAAFGMGAIKENDISISLMKLYSIYSIENFVFIMS